MKLKSNALLLLSSLSFFHHILQCLLIAPCGAASLQSCHRIRSFLNPLVHFNYPIICLLILCVSRLFSLSDQFYFHVLLIFYFMRLWHHPWSPPSSYRLVSSRVVSPQLVSSRPVSSRLSSSLVASSLTSYHVAPPPTVSSPMVPAHHVSSRLLSSLLLSSRLSPHTFSSRLSGRLVSEFTSQVTGLRSQVSDPKSPISCLMS